MTIDKPQNISGLSLPSSSKIRPLCQKTRIIQKQALSKRKKSPLRKKQSISSSVHSKKLKKEEISSTNSSDFFERQQDDSNISSSVNSIPAQSLCHYSNASFITMKHWSSGNSFQQKNESLIQKRVCQEPSMLLHNKWGVLPNKDYNIFGDILIETDFISDKKFSSQNYWKPPLNIEILSSKMLIRMNIGSYGSTMKEFSIINNFMKMCNNNEIQLFAHNLEEWQEIANKIVLAKQIKKTFSSDTLLSHKLNSNLFTSSTENYNNINEEEDNYEEIEYDEYSHKLKEFESKCEKKLIELNREGKIFWYSKKKYNMISQNLEEYECGFNQYLLAIMGCESQHLPAIVMRQGRPNFFDAKNRLKISQQLILNYLNINKPLSSQIEICPDQIKKVNLITFDDLSVPSISTSYCLNFQGDNENQRTSSFDTSYDFVLQIIEIDILADHIQELINIREFKNEDNNKKLLDLKENIQYEFDMHILLQKYYQNTSKQSLFQ